jgi:hypothetical protein
MRSHAAAGALTELRVVSLGWAGGSAGADGRPDYRGAWSGKSAVPAGIAFALEQRGQPYALLGLDYLSWAGIGSDRAGEVGLMMLILADVVGSYRKAGMP